MKILLLILVGVLLYASEFDELNLLEDLNNASEIATRTKLNINKTPAVVSVLHAKKLKKLGIVNLYEALESVPSIEISMGTAGAKQINIRGNKSLIRDKVKLMINGISVNSELSGGSYFYLDMPIELIERIEVIRGPSSALYGSFAHIGAINVITKSVANQESLVFANASSEGFVGSGFIQKLEYKKFKITLDGFLQENKNSRNYGPYDLIPSQLTFTSYEDFTNKSLGANIELGSNISFQTRWINLNTQNFFGYGDWPISGDPKRLQSSSFINELRFTPRISEETSFDIKAGYKEYAFEGGARYVPYSLLPSPPYPQNDLIGKGEYKEKILYSDIALNYTLSKHEILFGTYLSKNRESKSSYHINNPALSQETNIPINNIKKDILRYQYAFYLHDIYTISDEWILNVGGRYDHYSDVDSSFVPKVALLYENSDTESYKFMYQRSFRIPSWLELYGLADPYNGNDTLKSETIDTFEFVYSHQNAFDNRFTFNLFYSNMKNFINRDSNFNFFNDNKIRSYGVEVEWQYPLDETTELQSNYSFNHIEDENGDSLPFVANHLANIMLLKQWHRNFNSGTMLRYVSKHHREETDSRSDLDGYVRVDQTVTFMYSTFTLKAIVKNVFNEDIRFSSRQGDYITSGTYTDDFPRDGRTFWLSVEWIFQ